MIRVWDVSVFKNILAKEPLDQYALLESTAERAYLKASGNNMDAHLVISGGELFAQQDSENTTPSITKKPTADDIETMMAELYSRDYFA